MKVVTLARKPISGSVADSVAEWGTGSLNIDGTRIGTADTLNGGAYSPGGRASLPGDKREDAAAGMFREGGGRLPGEYNQPPGRWPSNVILQHKASCRQIGSTTTPGYTINRWTDGAKPFGGGAGHEYESEQQPDESVAVWKCKVGCAVRGLSEQSGAVTGSKDGGFKDTPARSWKNASTEGIRRVGYADTGTAARYFKQVKP